jgi:hypothetical protein
MPSSKRSLESSAKVAADKFEKPKLALFDMKSTVVVKSISLAKKTITNN